MCSTAWRPTLHLKHHLPTPAFFQASVATKCPSGWVGWCSHAGCCAACASQTVAHVAPLFACCVTWLRIVTLFLLQVIDFANVSGEEAGKVQACLCACPCSAVLLTPVLPASITSVAGLCADAHDPRQAGGYGAVDPQASNSQHCVLDPLSSTYALISSLCPLFHSRTCLQHTKCTHRCGV